MASPGIAVALLGRNHPVGVIAAALLFAVLQRGGVPVDAFTQLVSKDIVMILQALVILFVAAEAMFRRGSRRGAVDRGRAAGRKWPGRSDAVVPYAVAGFLDDPSCNSARMGRPLAVCIRSARASSTSRSKA
jgi:hypothetical protein